MKIQHRVHMRFQGVFTELHCTSMSAFTDTNKIWVDPHRVHCTADH